MGWEEFGIFDDPPEDKSGARKKSSEHGKLSWWDEFEDARFSDTGSTGRESTADAYSYRSAFDDSATSWYQQNNFRYSGYRDYSPSSLFRSAFTTVGWGAQSSDAKNKAIRALRTLKRNANTVAQAAAKISYDVQFSGGSDSNGVSAELAAGKKQTIYVSPDAVCKASTSAEEDEAVDALTGFVLLRVQLAQSVPAAVVREINETSMRGMALKIANAIQTTGGAAKAAEVAATVIDDYSAGVLAKSLLTRLSRREVVEDWGGFAPYFVRHAKQFAGTKEELIKNTELSVELLASRIAYNMAAADDAIELEPDVVAIVDKHLGAELKVDQMLAACRSLLADLRTYVVSKTAAPPADSLEGALTDGLQDIMDNHAKALAETQRERDAMREHMQHMADAVDSVHNTAQAEYDADAAGNTDTNIGKTEPVVEKLTNLYYANRLVDSLKNDAAQLNAAAALPETKPTAIRNRIRDANADIAKHMSHFAAVAQQLKADGFDFKPATDPAQFGPLPPQEAAKAQAEAITELTTALAEHVKNAAIALKDTVKMRAEAVQAKAANGIKSGEEQTAALNKLSAEFDAASQEFESAEGTARMIRIALQQLAERVDRLRSAEQIAKNVMANIAGADNVNAVREQANNLGHAVRNGLGVGDVLQAIRWHADRAAQEFAAAGAEYNTACAEDPALEQGGWHEAAIDEFLASINANGSDNANLQANAIQKANPELFDAVMSAFRDSDGCVEMPHSTKGMQPEQLDKLTGAAESMGMTAKEMLNLMRKATEDASHGRKSEMAEKLGALIREHLAPIAKEQSPIDDALFGEMIEKTTKVLDGNDIVQINDEARHAAEEEYVAYLSHVESKPTVRVRKAKKHEIASGQRLVKRVLAQNRAAVSKIREVLQFQDTKRVGEVHGMRAGDLDEGSLHKLRYDSEYIWSQKTMSRLPDVAVGILVDQSGSMGSCRKIEQAREMCIVLSEAVRKIAGVHLHIYGHTANQNTTSDLTLFEHYSSTASAENADLGSLGNIAAYSNNYDGYAIKETAKLLHQDPAQRKYLFVIADGVPHGAGYSGHDAEKHVASVCSFVRTRLKIPTYAFAVGVPEYEREKFMEQYGKNNVIFLSQVAHCLPQITRFLRNALQKEKTLVDVSAD